MERFLNRQNIIIFLMITAILYGLYEFFPKITMAKAPIAMSEKSQLTEIKQMVQLVTAGPKENEPSVRERYVMDRAESGLSHDPFFDRKAYRDWKLSQTQPKSAARINQAIPPSFNYTGYLEEKGKKIAIINGTEYVAGEQLDLKGYRLAKISPSQVVIENQANHKQFDVPFQD